MNENLQVPEPEEGLFFRLSVLSNQTAGRFVARQPCCPKCGLTQISDAERFRRHRKDDREHLFKMLFVRFG